MTETLASASFCATHPCEVNAKVYRGPRLQRVGAGDYLLAAHGRTLGSEMSCLVSTTTL